MKTVAFESLRTDLHPGDRLPARPGEPRGRDARRPHRESRSALDLLEPARDAPLRNAGSRSRGRAAAGERTLSQEDMSLTADAERRGDDIEIRALRARAGESEATGQRPRAPRRAAALRGRPQARALRSRALRRLSAGQHQRNAEGERRPRRPRHGALADRRQPAPRRSVRQRRFCGPCEGQNRESRRVGDARREPRHREGLVRRAARRARVDGAHPRARVACPISRARSARAAPRAAAGRSRSRRFAPKLPGCA